VSLRWGSFDTIDALAADGDFLYIDPPYAPVAPTANFTSYTALRFDLEDQARLQQLAIRLASRGCHVVLSNSTAPEIRRLYANSVEARQAGLRTFRVPARRAVNSNAARRGPVDEFVISNVVVAWKRGQRESGGTGRRAGLRIR
jgi:DNA adenine methylase